MSAAATAAGYLYASGRLRGRNAQEKEPHKPEEKRARKTRVGVIAQEPWPEPQERAAPKKTPKIEYRTRRWKPE